MAASPTGLLIFDVDGTLIDSSAGILKSVKRAISDMGLPDMSDDVIRNLIGPPIDKGVQAVLHLDDDTTSKFKADFREVYYSEHLFDASVYPGVVSVLRDISKEYVLAVATNKEAENTKKLLEHFGILGFFKFVEGSRMTEPYPKSDMVSKIVNDSGIPRRLAAVIGDGISDFKAADENEVAFIGAGYGFGTVTDLGTATIGSFSELPRVIADINRN